MPSEEGSELPEGLHYSSDAEPGITRRRAGRGFYYVLPDGHRLQDPEELKRIRALAIPPAYQNVWICISCDGHLQATGLDDRKRKQYRYHPLFQQYQNEQKFDRLAGFARRLPRIRQAVREGLRRRSMDREKILATAVFLLDETAIRIGNLRYAIENESYGLTTLRPEHIEIENNDIRFCFIGKSGKERTLNVRHRTVAKVLRNCQELPGEQLLCYRENGELRRICSNDVNAYLRQVSGAEIFAKDFRTWAGTLAAFEFLLNASRDESTPLKKTTVSAIRHAAKVLGNTPATCRKYYVHPAVLEVYLRGEIQNYTPRRQATPSNPDALEPFEKAVLKLIESESGA